MSTPTDHPDEEHVETDIEDDDDEEQDDDLDENQDDDEKGKIFDIWDSKLGIVANIFVILGVIATVYYAVETFGLSKTSDDNEISDRQATQTAIPLHEAEEATRTAAHYRPRLESSLIISETRNWDPNIERDGIFDNARQVRDVPQSDYNANTYYLWQVVENTNEEAGSCADEIEIQGPQFSFANQVISANGEVMTILAEIYPAAEITDVSTSNVAIMTLAGQLSDVDEQAHGRIWLFFYPTLSPGKGICGGGKLGLRVTVATVS